MKFQPKKLLANIICAFIPNRHTRRQVKGKILLGRMRKDILSALPKNYRGKLELLSYHNDIIITDDQVFVDCEKHNRFAREQKLCNIKPVLGNVLKTTLPDTKIIFINGHRYMTYHKINGVIPHETDGVSQWVKSKSVAHQLARVLARLHGAKLTADEKQTLGLAARAGRGEVLIHGDVGGNFVLDKELKNLVGVFDWDNLKYGPREIDIKSIFDSACYDLDFVKNFIAEYEKISGVKINFKKILQTLEENMNNDSLNPRRRRISADRFYGAKNTFAKIN